MEPRIQYAQTKDGVSIAYWTLGEGIPVIQMPPGISSHVDMEWRIPEIRRFYEQMAESRMLIRYDGRGCGSSDKDVAAISLDTMLTDLEAVTDRLGLESFALIGPSMAGPAAITFTARHPERVSHLILWGACIKGLDILASPKARALREMRDTDWELYTETFAHLLHGWSESQAARQYASLIRDSVTPEMSKTVVSSVLELDATDLASQAQAPTLVIHRRDQPFPHLDVAKRLAATIPGARLAILEGEAIVPWVGNTEEGVKAFADFLAENRESKADVAPVSGGLVTILFTDMESSSALRQRLGDAKAQELVRTHNTIVREALKNNRGSEIKHTGDGIMASFPTASGALECAIAIQRGVAAHVEANPDAPLAVYIGLNAGEPIAEEHDLFGTSVDLAARICAHADPGEILASDVVRQLAAGKEFLFSDRGDTEMRGFEDPVKLWEVRWRAEGSP